MEHAVISKSSYDYKSYTTVPVIASFDGDGHVKPLFVRIDGIARKIESYWVRYSFANQMGFDCRVIIEDSLRPVLLTYYQNECMWIVHYPVD